MCRRRKKRAAQRAKLAKGKPEMVSRPDHAYISREVDALFVTRSWDTPKTKRVQAARRKTNDVMRSYARQRV